MKYKILLTGENNTIIDDFFYQMSDDFEILTTSGRSDDIMRHVEVFEPDVFVYCVNAESVKDFNRFYFIKEKLQKKGVPLAVIGPEEQCKEFERITLDSADLVLEKPLTASVIVERLNIFIGKKKKAELEEEQKRQEEEEKAHEEELKQMEECHEKAKKHVLIIDDDPMMLKLVNEQLHERYDVATAISGKLALKFLEVKHTDLILLDYEMPRENGAEVLRKLRANPATKDIPVVFLTGVTERSRIQEVLLMQPEGYLLKPIDSENLFRVIADVLSNI